MTFSCEWDIIGVPSPSDKWATFGAFAMEITNQVGITILGEFLGVEAGIDTDFEQDWKLYVPQSPIFHWGGGEQRISVLKYELKSLNNENDEADRIYNSKYFFFSAHSLKQFYYYSTHRIGFIIWSAVFFPPTTQ